MNSRKKCFDGKMLSPNCEKIHQTFAPPLCTAPSYGENKRTKWLDVTCVLSHAHHLCTDAKTTMHLDDNHDARALRGSTRTKIKWLRHSAPDSSKKKPNSVFDVHLSVRHEPILAVVFANACAVPDWKPIGHIRIRLGDLDIREVAVGARLNGSVWKAPVHPNDPALDWVISGNQREMVVDVCCTR